MKPTLALIASAALLTGCIRPAISGTCHETGRFTSYCTSSRYYTSCRAGPEVRCERR